MDRTADALPVYGTLATITGVAINGLPADLVARRMRCVLVEELARPDDLRREAVALDADLRAGRWPLDRDLKTCRGISSFRSRSGGR
jgi:hypothetical protein